MLGKVFGYHHWTPDKTMNDSTKKENLIWQVRKALREKIDPKTRDTSHRFFKQGEEARVYGVKTAEVRKIGKAFFSQIKTSPKEVIFDFCETLWQSNYLEEAVVACIWSEGLSKQYTPSDFTILERWVKTYIDNWVACDTLCNHTIGDFIMKYPDFIAELKLWAKSSNRWVKRAAAVSLILPARKGWFLKDVFEIANTLLLDKDDMVQKGYGWLLKSASQAHQQEVFEYIIANKAEMPRTALRYAVEKLPTPMRKEAMRK